MTTGSDLRLAWSCRILAASCASIWAVILSFVPSHTYLFAFIPGLTSRYLLISFLAPCPHSFYDVKHNRKVVLHKLVSTGPAAHTESESHFMSQQRISWLPRWASSRGITLPSTPSQRPHHRTVLALEVQTSETEGRPNRGVALNEPIVFLAILSAYFSSWRLYIFAVFFGLLPFFL